MVEIKSQHNPTTIKNLNIYLKIKQYIYIYIIFFWFGLGIPKSQKLETDSRTKISGLVRYWVPKFSGISIWDFFGLVWDFWAFFSSPMYHNETKFK